MNWRWISITALLAALVIGYGAFTGRDDAPSLASDSPMRPTYYLRNAVITETQQDGSLSMRLAAARIEMQPVNDDLSMQDVHVNYHQSAEQQWSLEAERGFKSGDSPIVELTGDVQVRPVDGGEADVLQAEQLAIDTQNDVAYSTSSPVRIRYGHHALQVESFRFDMNAEKLQMKSIRGRYERS
jgi:LPS export ABC transporter protein LptC